MPKMNKKCPVCDFNHIIKKEKEMENEAFNVEIVSLTPNILQTF